MNTTVRNIAAATLAIATLVAPTATLALAGGPTLVAQPSQTTISPNGQFTVTVQMDTKAYQVTAAELHLTFPADKLQTLSVAPGTFLPNVLTAGATGSGTASITVGSGTQPKQGTGSVMIITFRAIAAGSAQIAFASNTQVAGTGQASNTVDTMTPTTVTVLGGAPASSTPTPLFSSTPQPTPITGIGGAGLVETGPGETTILALIMGSIVALLYVGYAGSDAFRRNEAKSYSKEAHKNPPDFRS